MPQDQVILEELLDAIEELRQRSGHRPERGHPSSVQRLRDELVRFADDVETGMLHGRKRRRRSGELFRRIVSLYPDVWRR